jgi:hypothetical protein
VLVEATRPPEDTTVRRGMAGYFAIAILIIALGLLAWLAGGRGRSVTGVLTVAALWSFVAGIAGFVLSFLWAFTDHLYSYSNENVLQFNPLSLVLLVLLVIMIFRLRKNPLGSPSRLTMQLATLVAALAVIGFVIQVDGRFDQVNSDAIALALPVHVAVWLALVMIRRRARQRSIAR